MQTAPFRALSAAAITLALAACHDGRPPANEPAATTTTTGVSMESGPAAPGDPGGATPEVGGPGVNSAAPADPMEGHCPAGGAPLDARNRADCIRRCRGLDETIPLGSVCVSAHVACEADCEWRYRF